MHNSKQLPYLFNPDMTAEQHEDWLVQQKNCLQSAGATESNTSVLARSIRT